MQAALFAQYVAVGLAVAASAAYVGLTRFPRQARALRGWVALRLVDSGRPGLSRLGRRIAPPPVHTPCGGCNGCD